MTVALVDAAKFPARLVGNGVSTVFAFQYKILAKGDIKVYVAGVLKTVDVDYTVTGFNNDAGGTVTFISGAPANGANVIIMRSMAQKRAADYQQDGDFLATTVNPDFDNAVLLIQDLAEAVSRSLQSSVLDPLTSTSIDKTSFLGQYLTVNAGGSLAPSVGTGNDSALRSDLANATTAGKGNELISIRRTTAEAAVLVTPAVPYLPENDVDRYADADAPPVYLQNVSALKNGWQFDALRAIPKSKWAAIRNYTSTYDCQPQLALLFGDMTTIRRAHVYLSDGLWNLGAALTNMPLKIRLTGAGRRSFGGSAGNYAGTVVKANFNTAAPIQVSQGGLTSTDILLENFGLYGTGTGTNIDGIALTNVAGVTLRDMVVAAFTRNNISLSGGNYLVVDNVYSAQAGNSNFYIDGEYCTLEQVSSDGGIYSVYATANGYGLEVTGRSHFEGPALRCLHILGNQFKMQGGILRPFANTPAWSGATNYVPGNFVSSGGVAYYCIQAHINQAPPNATYWYALAGATAAVNGAYINNDRASFIGTEISGSNSVNCIGLDSDVGANSYRYTGLDIRGFDTAMRLKEGLGTVTGSVLSGNATGLELIGGTYVGVIDANHISGVTNSILHTSGNGKWKIGSSNRLCDAANPQTFKPMTVTAGYPFTSGIMNDATGFPTVASAANITIPFDSDKAYISGTTNITSVTAQLNRTVTLIFQGVLTFTDGSNLKLAGNFVTTADDTITITCPDGVSWHEVSRSVN